MTINILFLFAGAIFLWAGAGWFIKGGRIIAAGIGVSPLIVGLTLGAVGTSLPELIVSTMAAALGNSGMSIGNVVGSNMANIGLALAVGAVIFPVPVEKDILKYDYWVALAGGILLYLTTANGTFSRVEGVIFIAIFLLYFSSLSLRNKHNKVVHTEGIGRKPFFSGLFLAITGLAGLLSGSRVVVETASNIARVWGVSDTIIGISVVAVGTSLPELAVVAAGSLKKQHEISIGTIMGSNIINIFLILGIAGVVNPVNIMPSEMMIQGPAVILLTLVLLPMLANDRRLSRREGVFLLALYIVYMYIIF